MTKDQIIAKIAQKILGIDNFYISPDSEDYFRLLSVTDIKTALEEAFDEGQDAEVID